MYAGKKHGTGVLSRPNHGTYTGAFHADKRHGFGTFQTPSRGEFKVTTWRISYTTVLHFVHQGLYRHDERFGPGVLTHAESQCADVGFWLSDDLVRLLYPHPTLKLDIHITDRKPRNDASRVLPSWHSPYQLLSTLNDLDFILNHKPYGLLCENIEQEQPELSRHLVEHTDRLQEVLHDKRAELDAYLAHVGDETVPKESLFNERLADVPTPNETSEQRQLFYHTNQFLPFIQQASFPVNEILSSKNTSEFLHYERVRSFV